MKVAVVFLVLAYVHYTEADYTCEITKGEKLNPVNNKRATLPMPCKFNAVRQQCGDYFLRITPGSVYVAPRFFLNTIWIGVKKGDSSWEGRTHTKSAIKYINDNGDTREPLAKKGGDLATEDVFEFSKTDTDVSATAVDGSFRITFAPYHMEGTKHRNVAFKFECFRDDEPLAFPNSTCGGNDKKEVYNRAVQLGFIEDGKKLKADDRDKTYYYTIFTDTTTDQTPNPECAAVVDTMVNTCASDEKRVEAINRCHTILYSKGHRKCATMFSCSIIEVFHNCVKTVCSDFTDEEACEALGESIDMCRNFPDLSEEVKTCYNSLYVPIEPNSVTYGK